MELGPPARGGYHFFVSAHNTGVGELLDEVRAASGGQLAELRVTSRVEELPECDFMVVYLNMHTWGGGIGGAQSRRGRLAADVEKACDAGVQLFLAHEALTFCEPVPRLH